MKLKFKTNRIFMLFVFVLVLLYSYMDMKTGSTSYNFSGESRASSHIMLAVTIAAMACVSIFLKTPKNRGYGPYALVLTLLGGWILLNCLAYNISVWTTATYVGFVFWWLFAFLMARRFCYSDQAAERFLTVLCLLMMVGMVACGEKDTLGHGSINDVLLPSFDERQSCIG